MKRHLAIAVLVLFAAAALIASIPAQEAQPGSDDPAITIYNQNFAVVRQSLAMDLKAGVNAVTFSDTTAALEPDSVVLRDPAGRRQIQIYEQNFRNDPVSQELLLAMFEGKTIQFRVDKDHVVEGKIIRSGYVPRTYDPGNPYQAYTPPAQPIIEVDGHLQFGLPGQPLFPSLGTDSILKPALRWELATDKPGALNAELSYVSGGMRWDADYNVIAPEEGQELDFIGWITMHNDSGKTFDHARIRLMAGDVNKLMPSMVAMNAPAAAMKVADEAMRPAVSERSFDEYHLYTLERPVTLRDHEMKQVEFVRATGVKSQKIYVYDGANIPWQRYAGWSFENIRNDPSYGTESNPKIWVMQEFKNSASNHLGIALPRGRMRFYRRDEEGRLQFIGENMIDHTPNDETVRLYTGNAFDIVGERKRTNYHVDGAHNYADESFEIHLRNHKKTAVTVRAVEHLYRWTNWQITGHSQPFHKIDANQIEFPVTIQPDGEAVITYTVHYSW